MEKHGGAREDADGNMTGRGHTPASMQHTDTLTQAHATKHNVAIASTHTKTCKTLLFNSNNGFVKAPQCYVVRALPLLLVFKKLDIR